MLGQRALAPLVFLAMTLLTWEALVRLLDIAPYILPAPSEALRVLGLRFDPIFAMAMITLRTTLIGFACGVGLGLTLGILIGSSRNLYTMVYPALVGFNAISGDRPDPGLHHLVRCRPAYRGADGGGGLLLSRHRRRRDRRRSILSRTQ